MGWETLAERQHGVVARRQLRELGVTRHNIRRNLDARRWVERTSTVVSTTTGPPTWSQRVWTSVLHAGGGSLVGGLTALEWSGLRTWHREEITILVDDEAHLEPVQGTRFFRTRRPLALLSDPRGDLPLCRVDPATLLAAGYQLRGTAGQGLLAAVVQQRLTTPQSLRAELVAMKPVRGAKRLRAALDEMAGGADSLAEIRIARLCRRAGLPVPRRQTRRTDAGGRTRFTDCEWDLPDGRTLVLEIDGAFHMDADHWEHDLARHRRLTAKGRLIIRCTARELRENPESVLLDLKRNGLCA